MNLNRLLALLLVASIAFAVNITVEAPVKQVTLYSNGFAFVTRSGWVTIPSGSHTLHIVNLTDSAVFPSIIPRHSSAKITEFYRYALQWNESINTTEHYPLEKLLNDSIGKDITFDFENETVRGVLVWFNKDLIGVSWNGSFTIYKISDIRRITLPATRFSEVRAENKSREEHGLAIGVKDGNGSGTLAVNYLVTGAGWDASYKYCIGAEAADGLGVLQGWAKVTNNAGEDWEGVGLKLVVGNPHIQPYYKPFSYPYAQGAAKEDYAAAAISPEFSASRISAYYIYSLAGPVSIRQGEVKSLPLFEKAVPYKREYFWNTSKPHPEKVFIFNNTGNESWTSGVVSIYLNDDFIGEDVIDYTPKNAEARVSVSDLPGIITAKETLNQTSTVSASSRTTYYKMRLSIRNAMEEDITLRINDVMYPGDEVKLLSSTIPAQVKPQNVLEWNVKIRKGDSLDIIYEYTVTNHYIEPRY